MVEVEENILLISSFLVIILGNLNHFGSLVNDRLNVFHYLFLNDVRDDKGVYTLFHFLSL